MSARSSSLRLLRAEHWNPGPWQQQQPHGCLGFSLREEKLCTPNKLIAWSHLSPCPSNGQFSDSRNLGKAKPMCVSPHPPYRCLRGKLWKIPVKMQQWICRESYILTPQVSCKFHLTLQIRRHISRRLRIDFKSIFRSVLKKGLIFTGQVAWGTQVTSTTLSTFKKWNSSLFLLAFWTDKRALFYIMLQGLLHEHTTQSLQQVALCNFGAVYYKSSCFIKAHSECTQMVTTPCVIKATHSSPPDMLSDVTG